MLYSIRLFFIQAVAILFLSACATTSSDFEQPSVSVTSFTPKSTTGITPQFEIILRELESKNLLPAIIHAANSAGTINFPATRFNLIRAGIALYGHPPSAQMKLPGGIASAISWKTRLISVKELPPGHGVSYGHKYHTKRKERIGVIAVGYGDGLRRRPGNFVLIHGKQVPIIGTVCMDQCMVNLDEIPDAAVGDEVNIIGKQSDVEISATDIANDWGTINYEVLCGLAARMPRYYLNAK